MDCASGDDCLLVKPNSKCAILYASGQMSWPKNSGGNTPAFKLQPPQEDDSLQIRIFSTSLKCNVICYRFIKQRSGSDCLLSEMSPPNPHEL